MRTNMKVVKVVAAIIIDNNKVFATQRGYGEFKDGWEFPGGKIEKGDLKLNTKTTTLTSTKTNETIEVVCKEFMLLECLMKNKNQIISKEQLYEKVRGLENKAESNNLEAYISFVRKKIKIIGSEVQIKAVRGLGYKLETQE